MRKFTLLKTMMLAIVLFASSGISAQLLVEDFDYTVGSLLTANGWITHSGAGTNSETVSTSSISYTGYASSGVGAEVALATTGEDVNKGFTSQTTGSVYAAFIVNVTSATTTGDYFIHFAATTGTNVTTFGARLWAKKDASNNLSFGISKSSTAANLSYTGFTYSLGTSYLMVIKYNFVTGATNDNCELFINPVIGNPEPVSTLKTLQVDDATADLPAIQSICLRQGNSSNAPIVKIDGIRVSTIWTEAVTPGTATPKVATPSFSPIPGNYVTAQNVTITSTDGSSIYYTLDGSDPDQTKTLYTSPISVSSTTTIKAKAYKTGMDPSTIAIGNYTFPTNVANIAALRAAPLGFYKLTGEAVLTLKTTTRNAKYIQDATGAVLIDDASAKVTTSYNLGDGISGIIGTTAFFNSMLQFTPVADPGAPTSTGKTVNPLDLTLTDLINHQAVLVKVSGVTISDIDAGTGSFVVSKSYNLNGAANPVLRTQYADLNYIGQTIPTAAQDIIGVVLVNGTTVQLVPRSLSDMVSTGLSTAKQNLKLFAANGKINFEAAEGETVEVYNTVGQKVLSAAAISGNNTLTVNAKGVVFVKVGNRTGKVIL